eukprot:SAG22_NODE_858_length_6831_cov_25.965538_3_plen_66_part_00
MADDVDLGQPAMLTWANLHKMQGGLPDKFLWGEGEEGLVQCHVAIAICTLLPGGRVRTICTRPPG